MTPDTTDPGPTDDKPADPELYPIGNAARRSGLSVSAVRYYADAGLVEPADRNGAGHRQIPGILRGITEEEAASGSPAHDDTHGRYLSLVTLINGTAPEDDSDSLPYAWIADAMRAPEPPPTG